MKKTGFAKKRDGNEQSIVDALEAVGCSIDRLNAKGIPDLLVGFTLVGGHGKHADGSPVNYVVTRLMEVKQPLGKRGGASHASLTPDQQTWWNNWKGEMPVIVRTPEEALAAIGLRIGPPGIWTFCPFHQCDGRRDDCLAKAMHRVGTYPRGKK